MYGQREILVFLDSSSQHTFNVNVRTEIAADCETALQVMKVLLSGTRKAEFIEEQRRLLFQNMHLYVSYSMWFHETVPLHILHAGLTTTIRRRDWA
jgi:hypothetical protein